MCKNSYKTVRGNQSNSKKWGNDMECYSRNTNKMEVNVKVFTNSSTPPIKNYKEVKSQFHYVYAVI